MHKNEIDCYDAYNKKWIGSQTGTLSTNANLTGSGVFLVAIPLGVLRNVRSEYGKKIRKQYEAGEINISRHSFLKKEIREDGVSNTIDSVQKDNWLACEVKTEINMGDILETDNKPGVFIKISDELTVYAVWYPKKQCYVAIRKLTPKECFRLQGWTDDYFEKARFVNSDSQLYKQAGNGVTVNVVFDIAKRM